MTIEFRINKVSNVCIDTHTQARQYRKEALREADFVILAGSVCDFRLSYGRVLPRKVPIIAINRNKDQLYKVVEIQAIN